MKRTLTLVLVLTLTLLLVACGGGSAAFMGKWSLEQGQPTWNNIEEMELLEDGTGLVDGLGVSWKVENNRFHVTHPLKAESWRYKISGTTLTLTNDDGVSLKYNKN